MASRPGEDGTIALSPRAMRIVGWLAVIALIAIIALGVRLLGGNADGTAVVPTPSASARALQPIVFGTELEPATSQVTESSRTNRFVAGETFAYSVATDGEPPAVVYVSVERTEGGVEEFVQPLEDGGQDVPADRTAIAFTVPAENLVSAFGPGTYRMRIHLAPDAGPIAEGTFELVSPASPEASPSG
jgi:hypothetical protein